MPSPPRKGEFLLPVVHSSMRRINKGCCWCDFHADGVRINLSCGCAQCVTPVTLMALALAVTFLVTSCRRSPNLQQELGQGKISFFCGLFHVCLQGHPYCSFLQGDMLTCFLYPPPPLSIMSQVLSQSWQQYIRLYWMCQARQRMAKDGSKSYWVGERKGK